MSTYIISTEPDITGIAPGYYKWQAWFGDGEYLIAGHGETEEAAVQDLLKNYDAPWEGK